MHRKGTGNFSEIRGKARKTAYSALSKQIAKVRQLLDERTLEAERDCLDKLKEELNEAQRSFNELIDNQWFDIRNRECFEIRAKLVERLNKIKVEFSLWIDEIGLLFQIKIKSFHWQKLKPLDQIGSSCKNRKIEGRNDLSRA